MAYGGGAWKTQNKIMPGAYVKLSSVKRASLTLSDRGVAAAPFALSWGEEGVVRLIEQGDFLTDCFEIFGYSYAAPEMVHLREIFLHATKCFCYRLPTSGGAKAKDTGAFVEAKYNGKRGNDIRVVVATALDGTYTVVTKVGTADADKQIVEKWGDLTDNDWVSWTKEVQETRPVDGEYELTTDEHLVEGKTYYEIVSHEADEEHEEAYTTYEKVDSPMEENLPSYFEQVMENVQKYVRFSTEAQDEDDERESVQVQLTDGGTTLALSGGSDGEIASKAHDNFLDAIEECSFNTLCCPVYYKGETAEETNARKATIRQYVSFTKRMRDDVGAYFQLVAHRPETADHEGVIGLWNDVNIGESDILNEASLTYWLTGAEAGCNVNETLTNTKYDGELSFDVDSKESVLQEHIEKGHLVFHRSLGEIVILTDINSLVTLREEFGQDFQSNQSMRACDQIANDVTAQFVKRYLGIVQNDKIGRGTLWNDVVEYLREMERLRVIEDFTAEEVKCERGKTKKSVLLTINVNILNAMEKLYMAIIVQ